MKKERYIKEMIGEGINVVSVSDSTGTIVSEGMPLDHIIHAKEKGGLGTLDSFEKMGALKAIADVDSDLVVEVTQSTDDGRPGVDHVLAAFNHGKDVVTANKGVLISDTDIIRKAIESGRIIRYEATVCGGVPVFNLMDYSIKTAKIKSIEGVFNATSSFVLSQMEQGRSKTVAISEAIKVGLAEHDPSDDLTGIDSARKGLILHRRLFGSRLTLKDASIAVSEEIMKPSMRQVTNVEKDGVSVTLKMKDEKRYLSLIEGPSMIIRFNTDTFDNLTLFTEHDGPLESSSAVLNDIVLAAMSRKIRKA
jgi:homoserine dehydrogenase